jgi:hypothetical protein
MWTNRVNGKSEQDRQSEDEVQLEDRSAASAT